MKKTPLISVPLEDFEYIFGWLETDYDGHGLIRDGRQRAKYERLIARTRKRLDAFKTEQGIQ